MAQPAADGARASLFGRLGWTAWLAPLPGRAEATTRVAVASTLTVLITAIYGTPEAAISAYVIFFINRADRTTSIVMSVAMLVLVSLIVALVIGLATVTLDDPMLRVACMALLSAVLLFLTSASKLRPVGAIVAMIVGFGLDELGLVPAGELATRGLLYAWLMVAIPIGANVLVNLVMGPAPRRLACARLAHCLEVAARSLRAPASGTEDLRDVLREVMRDGVQPVPGWLRLARFEGNLGDADLAALRQATASTTAILLAANVCARQAEARLPAGVVAPLADTLDEMAAMLAAGGYPVDITVPWPEAVELSPVQQSVATALRTAIERYAEADTAANVPAAGPAKTGGGFLDADAFTNRAHLHYALKTTGAAMFCYLLYQQLNWPGIHTCFITVYLVSLGTAAESVEKLTLRLAGCLVGAVAGTAALVFIVPHLDGVGGLLALVFAGTWLSAWVAQGSPRIAYAGFQIAFAFYLCVIQGPAPGFDLTIARDRVIGIVLGNLVVYLVFTRVWPVSIAGRIESALAALASQWRQLIDASQPALRRQHAASALALQGSIAQDLALARYEPASVGPTSSWVETRRAHLGRLDAVAGPLFLLAERFPGDPAVAARLRAIDAGVSPGKMAQMAQMAATGEPGGTGDPARNALLALVDKQLSETPPAASNSSAPPSSPHAQP